MWTSMPPSTCLKKLSFSVHVSSCFKRTEFCMLSKQVRWALEGLGLLDCKKVQFVIARGVELRPPSA